MSRKAYIQPKITSTTFRAEVGYAASGLTAGNPLDGFIELKTGEGQSDYQETEVFSEHNTWTSDNQSAFWN